MDPTIKLSEELTLNTRLPSEWIVYLYDKQLFKKMANKTNCTVKPHKEIYSISTINDLMYFIQLMKVNSDDKNNTSQKINLDMNDYIVMRKGIEPIWEDPKNSNGGIFTVIMPHAKGYGVWSTILMHMLGETLCEDMKNINGMTVSYISDTYGVNSTKSLNGNQTYIKIWDGKPDNTRNGFFEDLQPDVKNMIATESIMYAPNKVKKGFGDKKLTNNNYNNNGNRRGGFHSKRRY